MRLRKTQPFDRNTSLARKGLHMSRSRPRWVAQLCLVLLAPFSVIAQGTLDDYQRAERFLPQKMRKLVFSGDVTPHWIEKSNRFWYRIVGPKAVEFKLVDAEQNTT